MIRCMVHETCCEQHFDTAAARASARHGCLKTATASAHGDLDRLVMKAGFFDTPLGFRAYLLGMGDFYAALIAAHGAKPAGVASVLDLRQHLDWLSDDLRACGAGLNSGSVPLRVPQDPVPAAGRSTLEQHPNILGVMYVVCGSSKGAEVLQRLSVRRRLPVEGGSTYLGNMARSGLWDRFLSCLGEDEVIDERAMIDGACATFADVRRHLSERAPNDDHC